MLELIYWCEHLRSNSLVASNRHVCALLTHTHRPFEISRGRLVSLLRIIGTPHNMTMCRMLLAETILHWVHFFSALVSQSLPLETDDNQCVAKWTGKHCPLVEFRYPCEWASNRGIVLCFSITSSEFYNAQKHFLSQAWSFASVTFEWPRSWRIPFRKGIYQPLNNTKKLFSEHLRRIEKALGEGKIICAYKGRWKKMLSKVLRKNRSRCLLQKFLRWPLENGWGM